MNLRFPVRKDFEKLELLAVDADVDATILLKSQDALACWSMSVDLPDSRHRSGLSEMVMPYDSSGG